MNAETEVPVAENIAVGLAIIFSDLPQSTITWMSELMVRTWHEAPDRSDDLLFNALDKEVRAGNEDAIRMVVAAARRGFKI
ncbi:hypothetical protein SEA_FRANKENWEENIE_292 [Streptomyces phage Frankenweenie]|nr:hypothetical protein SEA_FRANKENWEENIE_292 [Streptomyces phage Frankenweenie]